MRKPRLEKYSVLSQSDTINNVWPMGGGVFYCQLDDGRRYLKTTDKGNTWTEFTSAVEPTDCIDGELVYADLLDGENKEVTLTDPWDGSTYIDYRYITYPNVQVSASTDGVNYSPVYSGSKITQYLTALNNKTRIDMVPQIAFYEKYKALAVIVTGFRSEIYDIRFDLDTIDYVGELFSSSSGGPTGPVGPIGTVGPIGGEHMGGGIIVHASYEKMLRLIKGNNVIAFTKQNISSLPTTTRRELLVLSNGKWVEVTVSDDGNLAAFWGFEGVFYRASWMTDYLTREPVARDALHDVWFDGEQFICGNFTSTDCIHWAKESVHKKPELFPVGIPDTQYSIGNAYNRERWIFSASEPYVLFNFTGKPTAIEYYKHDELHVASVVNNSKKITQTVKATISSSGYRSLHVRNYYVNAPFIFAHSVSKGNVNFPTFFGYESSEFQDVRKLKIVDTPRQTSPYYVYYGGNDYTGDVYPRGNTVKNPEVRLGHSSVTITDSGYAYTFSGNQFYRFKLPPPDIWWEKKVLTDG